MKLKRVTVLAAVIAALLLSPVAALAQALSDRVPADALVYVGWQGSDHMPAEFGKSRTKALLDSSALPQIMDQIFPVIIAIAEKEDKDAAEAMKIVQAIAGPMARHPSAFYFSGVDFLNPAGPRPKLAFLCDAGADAPALLEKANFLMQMAQAEGVPFPVKAFREGDIVVFAVGFDQDAQAIAGKDPAVKSIATNDNFKSALSKTLKEPVATVYIDAEAGLAQFEQFIQLADPNAAGKFAQVKDALGIAGLKRLCWAGGFADGDWTSRAFISAPAPRTGILALLDAKPLTDDSFKVIPKTATWAGVAQLDLAGLFTAIRDAAGKIEPQAQQMIDQGMGMAQMALTVNLEKDLFQALGTEWAVYLDPTVAGNGPLGLTVVNRLRKADGMEQTLDKIQLVLENQINFALGREKMRLTFGQTKVGNANVHYIQTPLVAPSWAVADGNLYFGLYPTMVAEATNHVGGKAASILENPAFVAARQKLGADAQKVSSFTFIDLPATAASGYQALLAISQLGTGFADMFGVKTPPMVLPPFNKFKQHLSPAASFSWSDDEGWHYRATSPFPGAELMGAGTSPAAFGVALLGAGAAVPAMARARENADRIRAASNLRQIGMGCMLYANDHRGKYPANLGPLILEADLHPDVFMSPNGQKMPPEIRAKKLEEQAAWAAANSDYVYLGASLTPNMGGEKILAYEKPEVNQHRGMNVLFNDGHVEWLPVEHAMQMIKAQQQPK